jgi:dihydrofolate synthase/folylpolyglutamate synthase
VDYELALEYLYGLTDYEKERISRYDPQVLDLSRVEKVLASLDSPERQYVSVHIAGTKGKGSVAVMCDAVLRAAGVRTGLYTSPHLHTFRERIRVDGDKIKEDVLARLVEEWRPVFDQAALTTFEAVTALALAYFARSKVDVAVVEVGLGGRLDATNVITPTVSVIASLSLDHTYLLGDTLAEIAYEKAGIIKPHVPVVCEPQEDEALDVIQQVCAERDAPLILVGRDWIWQKDGFSLEGQVFHLQSSGGPTALEGTYRLPLLGRYQINNAVAAIAALDVLRCRGFDVRADHVRTGLAMVHWPGRFEILRRNPPLVADCAHNGDSASKLAEALEEWFPGQRWLFIVGASNDKDVVGILEALAPQARRLILTQSRHARAMPSGELADLAYQVLQGTDTEIEQAPQAVEALRLALEAEDVPICITGSIFIVADAREAWALLSSSNLIEMDIEFTESAESMESRLSM